MNPDLLKHIPEIMDAHKNGIGRRIDWTQFPNIWNGLKNSDLHELKRMMVELKIIAPDPADNTTYTILTDYEFTLDGYNAKLSEEIETKRLTLDKLKIDIKLAERVYITYPYTQMAAWIGAICAVGAIILKLIGLY